MGKKLKSVIVRAMSRDELKHIIDIWGIETVDRRNRGSMARSVGKRHDIDAEFLLGHLPESKVKDVCEAMGLSSTGRKQALIDQLMATEKSRSARPGKARRESEAPRLEKWSAAPQRTKAAPESRQHAEAPPTTESKPLMKRQQVTGMRLEKFDTIAPGARILVRDAEWLVRRVDRTTTDSQAVTAVGISELVRDKEAIFLSDIDDSMEVLRPEDTAIVADSSSGYRASLLYMESLLRQTPPTDEALYLGHEGAMDPVPYQLDPAIQALEQPRQRILIADAVGLGKTIECGILLSELIRRGKGKRILVLAIKSMLTQFQKELWSRFTIPLVRLDSVGIHRVRRDIPTNHNPFYYYDKSIISIDTLKQDAEYRTYLENAYWDVIVIDEAQNVAERGKNKSMRSRLADLLSARSDTLIMLSATPHDGKGRSFASLMNMLDPTAIADPEDYGPEDIKGLFIRRFKKDIQDQVQKAFHEREISIAHCQATDVEEEAYSALTGLKFSRLNTRRTGSILFKTTLEKALFSSPDACLQTIENRLKTIDDLKDPASYAGDVKALESLRDQVSTIDARSFAKYKKLLEVIQSKGKGMGWTGKDTEDRLVIFTERIKTMEFLEEHLRKDLGLKKDQIETLSGSMPDVDQQRVVEEFGKDKSPVRLLVATDVASEGINLHYLCHKMIHFDIPWSLMVFKQRNGRIDRYGQEHKPRIVYLVTDSTNPRIKGDTRILELLIEKDEQAVLNIGDPSTWMGVYDIDTEEFITGQAIEAGKTAEQVDAEFEKTKFDPLEALMSGPPPTGSDAKDHVKPIHSIFQSDYAYLQAALEEINTENRLQVEFQPEDHRVELTVPPDLKERLKFLPHEIVLKNDIFVLSADKDAIQEEMRRSRKEETTWPEIHYLWSLNPVLEWANDKVLALFGRHEAPVVTLPTLPSDEHIFIVSGLIPNRKSHPLVHEWFGVTTNSGKVQQIEDFGSVLDRTDLATREYANKIRADEDFSHISSLLPTVVEKSREHMSARRQAFESAINPKLQTHLDSLEQLRDRHNNQLEHTFQERKLSDDKYDQKKRAIEKLFDDYISWIEDTMTTENLPYLRVVAVLRGGAS